MYLLENDVEFRHAVIQAANPAWAWEIQYGNLKNPPPKPSGLPMEMMKRANMGKRGLTNIGPR